MYDDGLPEKTHDLGHQSVRALPVKSNTYYCAASTRRKVCGEQVGQNGQ